jgi:hypothetical protein
MGLFIFIFVWLLLGFIGSSLSVYHSIILHGYWYTVAGDSVDEDVRVIYCRIFIGPFTLFYAVFHYFTEKEAGKRIFGLFNVFNVKKLRAMHRDNVLHEARRLE